MVRIRPATARHSKSYDAQTGLEGYGFYIGKRRRLDMLQFVCDFFHRVSRCLLAENLSIVIDTKEHEATQAVQHRAHCFKSLGALTSRTFEFKAIRLALTNELDKGFEIHART